MFSEIDICVGGEFAAPATNISERVTKQQLLTDPETAPSHFTYNSIELQTTYFPTITRINTNIFRCDN